MGRFQNVILGGVGILLLNVVLGAFLKGGISRDNTVHNGIVCKGAYGLSDNKLLV